MSRLLLLSLICLLAACGQKGALYLPAKPAPVPVPEASSAAGVVPAGSESAEKERTRKEKTEIDQPATAPQP